MILRNLALVCLGIIWFKGVCGASFSQVYVHNGLSGYQLPTVAYGAPGAPYLGSQQTRYNAPPIGSVVPYQQPASFNPCVIPCIPLPIPSQAYGHPYTPVEKAKVVYNNPNTVVVAPNAPSGYEYSYVVYDDQPGGQKPQKQWNNGQFGQFGQLFQGQYSFRQPGGYVVQQPQVQFTAEDLKGFNAVIKNYLPPTLPNYFSNVKPIVLIRAEPCEDPPTSSNNTKNGTEPTGKDDKKDKKDDKVDPKSFGIPELIEDPITEETTTSTTSTTTTTTTTTEIPTTEISTTTIAETTTKLPEIAKAVDKPSTDVVKPKVEPEVSEPAVAASNTYANVIRCIQESMKKPGQGGPSPLTYIISPTTPC